MTHTHFGDPGPAQPLGIAYAGALVSGSRASCGNVTTDVRRRCRGEGW
jgi:hypothetical protein